MEKGNLTREQAVAIIGNAAVGAAESKSCEPTNRVGYNGRCKGDELCEWSASAAGADTSGTKCSAVVYYYTTNTQDEAIAEQDGSAIDWIIAGYDVA